MSYNLILNSSLEDTVNWKLINCNLDNNILTSNKKLKAGLKVLKLNKPVF